MKHVLFTVVAAVALTATPAAADRDGDVLGALLGGMIIGGVIANDHHTPRYYRPVPRYYSPPVRYYTPPPVRYIDPICVITERYYDQNGTEVQVMQCFDR